MHRKPLQARSRRTYDALLDAAGTLLGEVGVDSLSTNLICERAGLTPPALYRYFDAKYAILEALAERLVNSHNAMLMAWVERYRDAGLDAIDTGIPELLRELHVITRSAPGAIWLMRALHAMPRLAHIRIESHHHFARVLAEVIHPYLLHVPFDLILRRTRLAVEIGYSVNEMLNEGEADPRHVFDDLAHVFTAMLDYPDYERHRAPTNARSEKD